MYPFILVNPLELGLLRCLEAVIVKDTLHAGARARHTSHQLVLLEKSAKNPIGVVLDEDTRASLRLACKESSQTK